MADEYDVIIVGSGAGGGPGLAFLGECKRELGS
jgi:pyruvate/2-oxoglutarate dehydrogenase complex dihydrolipoamide dehydrogenase (E3) component